MARRYNRDAKGRFAPKGYRGQTGGQGARLKSGKGNTRKGGGKRENLIGANDQTMTSLPKGTIGKTQRLRNRSKMDMSGQKFAKYEAGKKAAKADISRQKQEAWLKQTQKRLDNAPLAKEMSKAEFARRTGGKTRADSMGLAIEQSRQPHGRTKTGDRRNEARLRQTQDQVRATDRAYEAAIKSGKIKAPTDSLARKAAGEPSNPAVQAARRLQAKAAAKRSQSVDSLNAARKKANSDLDQKRASYFKTRYGTPEQKAARASLLAAEKKSEAATNAWRDAKAGIKPAAKRADRAASNVPMSGARGRRLDAEISRNVKQQAAAKRAESKARNRQFKSDQSRAKALRAAHVGNIAKAKGMTKAEVERAFKRQPPSTQIKALKNWVKTNRKNRK